MVIRVFVLLKLRLPLHIEVGDAIRKFMLFKEICKFDSAHLFVIVQSTLLPRSTFVKFMKGTKGEYKPQGKESDKNVKYDQK